MYADSELDYINDCRNKINMYPGEIFSDGNSLCKKVLRALKNECLLTARNGHDKLPPDFCSEECNIMFDAMMVNDTEIEIKKGKFKNSKKGREREMEDEINKLGIFDVEKCKVFCNSECLDYHEHSIDNFVKQARRVIENHIKKIKIWEKELPNIKYKGLFIFDECSVYFKGECKPTNNFKYRFTYEGNKLNVYFPWLDKNIMQQIYNSEIDFVIWYSPYKKNTLMLQTKTAYPTVVILDTRYHKDLVDYVYEEYELS